MLSSTFLIFLISTLMSVECGTVHQTHALKLGQSRVSILLELSKQVIELQAKTSFTWLGESIKVSGNKKSIKNSANRAESSIETKLGNLDKEVGNIVKKAYKSGKDISACLVTEQTNRWVNVDSSVFSQCTDSLSFTVVGLKLSELLAIPAGTAGIVPYCTLFHPFSNDNFKSCLQNEVDKLQTKLSTITKNLEGELNTITENGKKCVQDNSKSLELEIKNILNDFNECVKKVKSE